MCSRYKLSSFLLVLTQSKSCCNKSYRIDFIIFILIELLIEPLIELGIATYIQAVKIPILHCILKTNEKQNRKPNYKNQVLKPYQGLSKRFWI